MGDGAATTVVCHACVASVTPAVRHGAGWLFLFCGAKHVVQRASRV
jgi:hypothetical protein